MQDGNRTSYLSEYKWYASNQSSNQIEARGLFADPIFLQQNPEQRNEDHGNITWKAVSIIIILKYFYFFFRGTLSAWKQIDIIFLNNAHGTRL
jgi:hypothetical protein